MRGSTRTETVARKQKRNPLGIGRAEAHDEWTNYRVHEIMRLPF